MSKQLAISIVFSVMTMSAFAVSYAPLQSGTNLNAGHKNGAVAKAAAPPFFSVLLND